MTAALTAAVLVLLSGCSSGEEAPPADRGSGSASPAAPSPGRTAAAAPAKGSVEAVRTVAEGLDSPWGLVSLPDGDLLVSSRNEGTVSRIDGRTGQRVELGAVPGVAAAGEGGLLGIALSPAFDSDRMVYAYFTTASDNRIARMRYEEDKPTGAQLGAPSTVLRGIPKGTIHNGGRIAFGPDGMLYAGTGEIGDTGLAQDKESLAGKVLRMTPTGEPAPGNPFGEDSYVYSYGHRNVQGLAWDEEGRLWASEFGQDTWDELNHIVAGDNYGWPEAEGKGSGGDFHDPVAQWRTSDASPSGIAYAAGSIWLAGLRGERLWRVPVRGVEGAPEPEEFLRGEYGRLRTVVAVGGNTLLLTSSETDGRGTPGRGDDRMVELEVE
ncbi:PQQ-dependent sugar dehydrogenase [Streptomyces sp. LE64]|uniref:PQQ-dependent sugar dehydrogenase n=1 Tax=Streptomyces sp. LE64 TaxID=3448653 RepID=UPI004041CE3B